jgi:nicotinate-nucleotide pyrophosphorylase
LARDPVSQPSRSGISGVEHRFVATGVDLLSVGWITHSAPALDVALDI